MSVRGKQAQAQPTLLRTGKSHILAPNPSFKGTAGCIIRAAGFLLEFNDRKKRVGLEAGNVRDYEAGTVFYERQHKRGRR